MKKCPECGNLNESKFCTYCGYDLSKVAASVCPNCGFETESKFCPSCGFQMKEEAEQSVDIKASVAQKTAAASEELKDIASYVSSLPDRVYEKKNTMTKGISIVGTITGVLSIIFSFYIMGLSTGATESNYQYGGDAYTGMQNASAQAANNIYNLTEIMRFGFFAVLFIAGLILLCHYVPVLIEETRHKEKAETKPTPVIKDDSEDQSEVLEVTAE